MLRNGGFDLVAVLDRLPDPVYLTVDVDVFDWSVVRSTGTPESGGLLWDEGLSLLQTIFLKKNVVALDVMELSADGSDPNSAFAVAKLIYRMMGFKLATAVRSGRTVWPNSPQGALFSEACY